MKPIDRQKIEKCLDAGEICTHTSYISDPWPTKHSNELTGRASIVTDGDDIGQGTVVVLYDLIEDVHQAIGSGTTAEDHDLSFGYSIRDRRD